jgi:hypothetical protein
VGVLAMEVDQRAGQVGQVARRQEAPVPVGPGAPRARDDARQHQLVVADHEPTLDGGLRRPGTHDGRVGAIAGEEPDGADDHGLARAGLAGERGHARIEDQREAIDDPEIADDELSEHRDRAGRLGASPSSSGPVVAGATG